MKIVLVVGARPNFMKVAPLHRALVQRAFDSVIVHTGQHYDRKMSDVFFRQLGMPSPAVHLGVGSGTHAVQTARVMKGFERVLNEDRPDLVLVVGDVNSTLACALVASKLHVPVAHVEAGLRSGDRAMPEEINRLATDAISDLLFVTEESGVENLRREGISEDRIHFVGNVMIDTLVFSRSLAARTGILRRLGVRAGGYALVTVHRPSNVDTASGLRTLMEILRNVAAMRPVVFPMHPRTADRFGRADLLGALRALRDVQVVEPMGYFEFLRLTECAALVITDSGGIQEETTYLQIPCLTLRDNTERPVTITVGTNELVAYDADRVAERARWRIEEEKPKGHIPPLWDGHAAERIAAILADNEIAFDR